MDFYICKYKINYRYVCFDFFFGILFDLGDILVVQLFEFNGQLIYKYKEVMGNILVFLKFMEYFQIVFQYDIYDRDVLRFFGGYEVL